MKKNLFFVFVCAGSIAYGQTQIPAPYCAENFDNMYLGCTISAVALGTLNNVTGAPYANNSTYNYYNNLGAELLVKGNSYTLSVTYPIASDIEPMYAAAWIDYNNNNAFEASEMVLNNANSGGGALPTGGQGPAQTRTVNFTVPLTATNGTVRMRVMRGQNTSGNPYTFDPNFLLSACVAQNPNSYGEVEDYDVNITGLTAIAETAPVVSVNVVPNPASEKIEVSSTAPIHAVQLYTPDGRLVMRSAAGDMQMYNMDISTLAAGLYLLEVETAKGTSVKKVWKT